MRKTLLPLALLLTGCYMLRHEHYSFGHGHQIVEDSVLRGGKVIYRTFRCVDSCKLNDTIPNPKYHPEIHY
jgi:hypothetical protein